MVLCLIFKTTQSPCELNVCNPVKLKYRDGTGKVQTVKIIVGITKKNLNSLLTIAIKSYSLKSH